MSTHPSENVVDVRDLTVCLKDGRTIVDKAGYTIRPGEILGLVGQSGSGKTTAAMALLGYTRHGAHVTEGQVTVAGTDVTALDNRGRRLIRGRLVSYVPQDPRASLNPALTIRRQLTEVLDVAGKAAGKKARRHELVRDALEAVGLPCDRQFAARFPHQLSGGQLQRVGIAMGIVAEPPVIVFDEPTTGLDVTTQRRILDLVRGLCSEHGIAGLYVSHDLAVVAELADRVMVMNEGRVVEQGTIESVFLHCKESYTRRLLDAAPDINPDINAGSTTARPAADRVKSADPILGVKQLAAGYRRHQALRDVSFDLRAGECLAVVGESGSGKSTLSRAVIGLHPGHSGAVHWRGVALPRHAGRRSRDMVKDIQYIFQSPFNALNPRMTIEQSVGFAYRLTIGRDSAAQAKAVREAITRVELPLSVLSQLPNRLSGGERQRVAIARALVACPSVLICDEITSSLDVLIQASILDLLNDLKKHEGLAMLFVTHNLALIRSFADRVLVIDQGRAVEHGTAAQVLTQPQHAYTRQLLTDAPSIRDALDRRLSAPHFDPVGD